MGLLCVRHCSRPRDTVAREAELCPAGREWGCGESSLAGVSAGSLLQRLLSCPGVEHQQAKAHMLIFCLGQFREKNPAMSH